MKSLILTGLLLLFFAVPVRAADIPLEWRVHSPDAVGYKIKISEDCGLTWTEISNLIFTTRMEGALELASATITVPDGVLVLIRVGTYDNIGEAWNLGTGTFYNSNWQPLIAPTGVSTP